MLRNVSRISLLLVSTRFTAASCVAIDTFSWSHFHVSHTRTAMVVGRCNKLSAYRRARMRVVITVSCSGDGVVADISLQ